MATKYKKKCQKSEAGCFEDAVRKKFTTRAKLIKLIEYLMLHFVAMVVHDGMPSTAVVRPRP
jgi:hypothetical protein